MFIYIYPTYLFDGFFSSTLQDAVAASDWASVSTQLEKGSKGRGSNAKGEGTGTAASLMRNACRAFGLFG